MSRKRGSDMYADLEDKELKFYERVIGYFIRICKPPFTTPRLIRNLARCEMKFGRIIINFESLWYYLLRLEHAYAESTRDFEGYAWRQKALQQIDRLEVPYLTIRISTVLQNNLISRGKPIFEPADYSHGSKAEHLYAWGLDTRYEKITAWLNGIEFSALPEIFFGKYKISDENSQDWFHIEVMRDIKDAMISFNFWYGDYQALNLQTIRKGEKYGFNLPINAGYPQISQLEKRYRIKHYVKRHRNYLSRQIDPLEMAIIEIHFRRDRTDHLNEEMQRNVEYWEGMNDNNPKVRGLMELWKLLNRVRNYTVWSDGIEEDFLASNTYPFDPVQTHSFLQTLLRRYEKVTTRDSNVFRRDAVEIQRTARNLIYLAFRNDDVTRCVPATLINDEIWSPPAIEEIEELLNTLANFFR